MADLDLGGEAESLGGHVRGGADSSGGKCQGARLRLSGRNEVSDCLEPALGGSDHQIRRRANQSHWNEIADRIVRKGSVQHDFGGHRRRAGHERVAIGVGPGHRSEADASPGARLHFDDDRLSDELRHLVHHDASDGVRGTSGRVRADHSDGSGRILLRIRRRGCSNEDCRQGGTAQRAKGFLENSHHVNTSIPGSSYRSRRARAGKPPNPRCRGRHRDARTARRSWRKLPAAPRAVRRRLLPSSTGFRRR